MFDKEGRLIKQPSPDIEMKPSRYAVDVDPNKSHPKRLSKKSSMPSFSLLGGAKVSMGSAGASTYPLSALSVQAS